MLELTDQNFDDDVLKSDSLTIVDFWAPWCGPCKIISPIVENIAEEYKDQVKVGKMNVDDNPSTASRYGIRSIPTLMFFKGGNVVQQLVGVVPKAEIKEAIKAINENI